MTGQNVSRGFGRCPVCGAALWAEVVLGPERCPRCSAELWSICFSERRAFFVRRPEESVSEFLERLVRDRLPLSRAEINAVLETADSFDVFEFLLEIEAALNSKRPCAKLGNE